jgi:hypothetical protein
MRFKNILKPPHLKEGYKIMPPMDKEKYPELPGLEGPFTMMSGKVVYYDPKEGAYYDKDTDMYMSYDEFQQHDNDYSNMKDERDEVKKEADELNIGAKGDRPYKAPRQPKRGDPINPKSKGVDPKVLNMFLTNGVSENVAVRRDGKTLSKGEKAKLQRQGVLMKEGARGLGSIDWPEEEMMQTATDAIRYGYSKNDSFSHLYSMYGDDHGKWLRANEDMILDVFSQYVDEGAPKSSPRPKPRPKTMPRPKARPTTNIGGMPGGSTRGIDPKDNYSPEDLKRLLMQSAMEAMEEAEEEGMIVYVGDQKFEYSDYTLEDAMRIVDEYADEMEGEPYEVYNADGKLVASGTMRSGAFHEPGIEEGYSPGDENEEGMVSNCCGAPIMDVYQGHGRCSDCKEMASAVNEDVANESVEDIIKRAMKELKRIDPQVMFRTRDMMKAVATIKQGNIAGALQDLVNGVDGPENQIQDVFNSTHDTLQRLINPKTDKEVDDEYWADVDYDKARNRVGETRSKVRMPEGDGRKKGIHPKGHPMRKKQQAAIHAGESKRKVSINQVCEAVKQTDPTYAVAMYVRTTLDPSYKTWDQVHEQVKHILSCINEGKTVNANTVMQLLSRQNLQEKADKEMMRKENIDSLRKIVKENTAMPIKFSDGLIKVDATTANIFLEVFNKQKQQKQNQIVEKIQTKSGFLSMLEMMYKKIG